MRGHGNAHRDRDSAGRVRQRMTSTLCTRRRRSAAAWLLALIGSVLPAAPAAAQSVVGVVHDEDRGRPIRGARLLLLDAGGATVDSTRADAAARFRLTAPGAGEYTVYFQMDGWAGIMSETVAVPASGAAELDFRVPLVANAAIRDIGEILGSESRLQESLPQICGEPFRAWEAGLLVGVVRLRSTREPIADAVVEAPGSVGAPGSGEAPGSPEHKARSARAGEVEATNAAAPAARSTLSGTTGVYVLCNLPLGDAVPITVRAPDGTVETTEVEIRAGTASWYDLLVGPRRR
jgi:hypothetical protein